MRPTTESVYLEALLKEVLIVVLKEVFVSTVSLVRFQVNSNSPNVTPQLTPIEREIVRETVGEEESGDAWALSIEPFTRLHVGD